jgi:ABC-type transport system involved in multi-copper enzyme maturation permease subunit
VAVDLLHYRPWRGEFHSPGHSVWPIARLSLGMMFRRKMFWVLYALALFIFLLFFFGQYLLYFAQEEMGSNTIRLGGRLLNSVDLVRFFRLRLKMDGGPETYRNLFWYQGYMVMIVLAFAGTVLIGNDIRHGSLPFYLSKPVAAWHYLAGKFLALAVFVNLMTTLPALALFVQNSLLDEEYLTTHGYLLPGLLAYGLLISVVLGLTLLAVAVAVRRTIPLIMAWTTIYFFARRLSEALVDQIGFDARWKLLDIWNNLYLVGNSLLRVDPRTLGKQPELFEAALVLGAVSLLCLTYLVRRIRAVEVVS